MSNKVNRHTEKQSIISTINGLIENLQKLPTHPDQANSYAPIFLKGNDYFKPANENDGILGAIIIESLLGTAFSEAITELNESVYLDSTTELYSEYIKDKSEKEQKSAAHGQGTLARLSKKPITSNFNTQSSTAMQNFMDSLAERMMIEQSLGHYAKELEIIDTPSYEYAA